MRFKKPSAINTSCLNMEAILGWSFLLVCVRSREYFFSKANEEGGGLCVLCMPRRYANERRGRRQEEEPILPSSSMQHHTHKRGRNKWLLQPGPRRLLGSTVASSGFAYKKYLSTRLSKIRIFCVLASGKGAEGGQ